MGFKMNTILLDPQTWDLLLDSAGNIAVAGNPYSIAQDVASAIKLFSGEAYYDTSKGVPYFEQILGAGNLNDAVNIMAAQAELAALTVPEVVKAQCTSLSYGSKTRTLTGIVEVIDLTGNTQNISF